MLKKAIAVAGATTAIFAPNAGAAKLVPPKSQFTYSGKASVFEIGFGIATRCYQCKYKHGYWLLEDPRHGVSIEVQSDWGPDAGTGRAFDLTADTTSNHRYSYSYFPTDIGTWKGHFIGYHIPMGLHYGRQPGGMPYHGWQPFMKRMQWHSKSYWIFIYNKYQRHFRDRNRSTSTFAYSSERSLGQRSVLQ